MEDIYQGYKIKSHGKYPFKIVTAKGSGGVPVALSGMYTNVPMAKRGIDLYLSTLLGKKKKVNKDGESKHTS